MLTKNLEKGTLVQLRNGWKAEVITKGLRGPTPMVKVYGDYTEIGSVYAHDIVAWCDREGQWHHDIELTASQVKTKNACKAFGW